jgi:hypothetical protein
MPGILARRSPRARRGRRRPRQASLRPVRPARHDRWSPGGDSRRVENHAYHANIAGRPACRLQETPLAASGLPCPIHAGPGLGGSRYPAAQPPALSQRGRRYRRQSHWKAGVASIQERSGLFLHPGHSISGTFAWFGFALPRVERNIRHLQHGRCWHAGSEAMTSCVLRREPAGRYRIIYETGMANICCTTSAMPIMVRPKVSATSAVSSAESP